MLSLPSISKKECLPVVKGDDELAGHFPFQDYKGLSSFPFKITRARPLSLSRLQGPALFPIQDYKGLPSFPLNITRAGVLACCHRAYRASSVTFFTRLRTGGARAWWCRVPGPAARRKAGRDGSASSRRACTRLARNTPHWCTCFRRNPQVQRKRLRQCS